MSHKKGAGTAKNLRDSKPKYLGIKLSDGQKADSGCIIVRQRGTKILAGKNVRYGKDHTIYSVRNGKVKFSTISKTNFDGSKKKVKMVDVV